MEFSTRGVRLVPGKFQISDYFEFYRFWILHLGYEMAGFNPWEPGKRWTLWDMEPVSSTKPPPGLPPQTTSPFSNLQALVAWSGLSSHSRLWTEGTGATLL